MINVEMLHIHTQTYKQNVLLNTTSSTEAITDQYAQKLHNITHTTNPGPNGPEPTDVQSHLTHTHKNES